MTHDPIYRRNAGLRRISNVTKGVVAGGLVLTGGLSALAARSFSGTSTAQTQQSTTATTPSISSNSSSSDDDESANATTPALQSPSYYLQPSSGSGRVRSGGS